MFFVVSVQFISNDMLWVGDWIEMLQVGVDGDVVDIILYIVKVQNFDKIIVLVLIWCLMLELFKNWCGMQQFGGWWIKWVIYVDFSQVCFFDEKEEWCLSQVCLFIEYMVCKQIELQEWNVVNGGVVLLVVNCCWLINIGMFCVYVFVYLQNYLDIYLYMICMVCQLQLIVQGILLEIYCFICIIVWVDYECIQGDVFDYLLVVMLEFGFGVYQQFSGQDLCQGLQGMFEGCDVEVCLFEVLVVLSCSDEVIV